MVEAAAVGAHTLAVGQLAVARTPVLQHHTRALSSSILLTYCHISTLSHPCALSPISSYLALAAPATLTPSPACLLKQQHYYYYYYRGGNP